jgi:serine/threonine protein kinase
VAGDPLLHGRYRLVRALGEGGGGQTWLAIDEHTGASVAVKELRAPLVGPARDVVDRETSLLASLHHPQIPKFIEAFVEDVRMVPRLHLVLEYVDGTPLSEAVAQRRFAQGEVKAIVLDLLAVVTWLHGLAPPLLHRDIKPSNVILRPNGTVALIDFGVATDAVDRTFQHTMAVGTLGYQAPEQIAGEPIPASDVYSVGVLALELLTRTPPRTLLSGQTLRWEGSAKHLDPAWRAWLTRALDPNPSRRFPDARVALRALQSPGGTLGAPDPRPNPAGQAPKRSPDAEDSPKEGYPQDDDSDERARPARRDEKLEALLPLLLTLAARRKSRKFLLKAGKGCAKLLGALTLVLLAVAAVASSGSAASAEADARAPEPPPGYLYALREPACPT